LILDYQKKIDQMRVAVGHLDASIKLFAPDYDLRTVRAKMRRARNSYFKPGDCQRLVLEAFREADGTALSSRQIGEALVQCDSPRLSKTSGISYTNKTVARHVVRLRQLWPISSH
jgi:hypothetical protein